MVDPSIERIVALHPDVVFAESKANRASTIDALQRLGIPVVVIRAEGLDGILQAVQQVGTALNRTPVARALVDRSRVRREEVARRVRGLPKPRVFVLIWPDPVVTVGQHACPPSSPTGSLKSMPGSSIRAPLSSTPLRNSRACFTPKRFRSHERADAIHRTHSLSRSQRHASVRLFAPHLVRVVSRPRDQCRAGVRRC